jgi:hypothetical protein
MVCVTSVTPKGQVDESRFWFELVRVQKDDRRFSVTTSCVGVWREWWPLQILVSKAENVGIHTARCSTVDMCTKTGRFFLACDLRMFESA